jgi:L,D-peptidoglycan transpeptidase YkuD (ErfK/YbiS/YcfS/YnhG family)
MAMMAVFATPSSSGAIGYVGPVVAHQGSVGYPGGLRRVDHARQLVLVTSSSSLSSHAVLRTFVERGDRWVPAFGPMAARIGVNGWMLASRRREGDGTTPEGLFVLGTTIYGNAPDPGVALRFHRLMPGDYWDENPATGHAYNTFVHSADTDCAHNPYGGDTECLWLETVAYRYFAVVNFNTPSRGPYGSAIFLHVTIGATTGCVSVSLPNLVRLLRWLKPKLRPTIVLAGPLPLHEL